MAKTKNCETQTADRDADCYRAYHEALSELKRDHPSFIMEISSPGIARIAMEKRPSRFYMSERHFIKCVKDHESRLKGKTKSGKE